METTSSNKAEPHFINKAKQVAAGLALTAIAAGGGVLAAEGAISLTHDIAITTPHAEPSNMLADGFTLLEEAGAAVGAAVLLKRGLRHFKLAYDTQEVALDEVAHSSAKTKTIIGHRVPRVLATCGLLTTFTGVVAGNFFDVADNVSKSQSNIAGLFNGVLPQSAGQSFVISNNPTPNMLNNSNVSRSELDQIDLKAKTDGVKIIPILHAWGGGSYNTNPSAQTNNNLEFLTIGLPDNEVKLPLADAQCNNVQVDVSSALGVKPGEFFDLQGLKVEVDGLIQGHAGFNLLPVILNNTDYSNCLLSNNSSSYNMIVTEGSKSNIESIINSVNANNKDASKRLYAVTTNQFINNAEATGKNAVNGLVLEAMMIGMALGAVALNYKTSQELANNRSRNRMLKANGYDEHMILKIYKEKAEADAVSSALLAMPGTLIVDALVNHAQPGGALGVNLETYAAVTGLLWTVNRLSTLRAVRKEALKMSNERNKS